MFRNENSEERPYRPSERCRGRQGFLAKDAKKAKAAMRAKRLGSRCACGVSIRKFGILGQTSRPSRL